MLLHGAVDFVASDCHNTTTRPQRMGEVLERIGPEGRDRLEENLRPYFPA